MNFCCDIGSMDATLAVGATRQLINTILAALSEKCTSHQPLSEVLAARTAFTNQAIDSNPSISSTSITSPCSKPNSLPILYVLENSKTSR
jgi:hypothetical protein